MTTETAPEVDGLEALDWDVPCGALDHQVISCIRPAHWLVSVCCTCCDRVERVVLCGTHLDEIVTGRATGGRKHDFSRLSLLSVEPLRKDIR